MLSNGDNFLIQCMLKMAIMTSDIIHIKLCGSRRSSYRELNLRLEIARCMS